MESGNTRIEELRASFLEQPSARAIGAVLTMLSVGYAEVEVTVSEELLVNGDLPPGQFVQGGYLIGVLPNFAGVYAAMTLSAGHALLIWSEATVRKPAVRGERLRASARAERKDREVVVSWQVESITGETKSVGSFKYRLKRSESVPD